MLAALSPVLLPEILEVPVTANVGVEVPERVMLLTVVGVIAPKERVRLGVVPPLEEPVIPFALVTSMEVRYEPDGCPPNPANVYVGTFKAPVEVLNVEAPLEPLTVRETGIW